MLAYSRPLRRGAFCGRRYKSTKSPFNWTKKNNSKYVSLNVQASFSFLFGDPPGAATVKKIQKATEEPKRSTSDVSGNPRNETSYVENSSRKFKSSSINQDILQSLPGSVKSKLLISRHDRSKTIKVIAPPRSPGGVDPKERAKLLHAVGSWNFEKGNSSDEYLKFQNVLTTLKYLFGHEQMFG